MGKGAGLVRPLRITFKQSYRHKTVNNFPCLYIFLYGTNAPSLTVIISNESMPRPL